VTTDDAWRAGRGGITSTSFYDGETYVQDDEPPGWESPGFDDSAWEPVSVVDLPDAVLVGPQFPSIRIVGSLPVRDWLTSPSGATIADFGQVFTGHVRLRLRGAPGSVVTLRVAEVLDAGELALRPQRDGNRRSRSAPSATRRSTTRSASWSATRWLAGSSGTTWRAPGGSSAPTRS
jgi:alpha-L-rhamnosidase